MSHGYSTAFSYLVLGATGWYCCLKFQGGLTMPYAAYGIIVINSVLGAWRFGIPDRGNLVEKPYNFTNFLQGILVLPLIVTEVWMKNGMQKELACLHVLACAVPFILYLSDRSKEDAVDLIIGINCVSLGICSAIQKNYYGVAAAVSYLVNHFWLREGRWNFEDIPVLDLFNYGLSIFSYLALCSLGGN